MNPFYIEKEETEKKGQALFPAAPQSWKLPQIKKQSALEPDEQRDLSLLVFLSYPTLSLQLISHVEMQLARLVIIFLQYHHSSIPACSFQPLRIWALVLGILDIEVCTWRHVYRRTSQVDCINSPSSQKRYKFSSSQKRYQFSKFTEKVPESTANI